MSCEKCEFKKTCEGKPNTLKRSAFNSQVGGNHYKDMPIGPTEYAMKNNLNACEYAVVKYVSRHRRKGGKQDLEKAIHYIEMLIELEYA